MQDICEVKEEQQAEVELENPITNEPMGAWFLFAGPEHPVRKTRSLARMRKARKTFEKTQTIELGDPEDDLEKQTEDMVAATLGWRCNEGPFIVFGGNQLPYSAEAVRALYTDPDRAWLRRWAKAKLENIDVFTKACSPPSALTPAGTAN